MKNRPFSLNQSMASAGLILLSLVVSPLPSALAQFSTWTGESLTSSDWTDAANWGGTAPVANDSLTFSGSARLTNNNDFAVGTQFNSIFFNSTESFVLDGNEISLGGNIAIGAASIQTINFDLELLQDTIFGIFTDAAEEATLNVNGDIRGAADLTLQGTNSVGWSFINLSGTNTYTGTTYVGGVGSRVSATVGSPDSLPGVAEVADGSTLRLKGSSGDIYANSFTISGNGTQAPAQPSWLSPKPDLGALVLNDGVNVTGNITLAANARISAGRRDSGTSGLTGTISGIISGNYDLAFGYAGERPGAITLTNPNNDWTGDTYITGGAATGSSGRQFFLIMGADNVLPGGVGYGDVYLQNINARMNMDGTSQSINGLNSDSTGALVYGGGTLSVGGNDADGTFTGGLTVTTLIKNGTGTQSFRNGTIGTTTVNAGVVVVDGGVFNGGAINVASGAAFQIDGGNLRYTSATDFDGDLTFTSGRLSGSNWNGGLDGLTIGAGQVISPGSSPGQATTGTQAWADGGAYEFEINDADGTLGTNWDHLTLTTSLDISGLSEGGFTLQLVGLTGANAAGLVPNFDALGSYEWEFASFASLIGTFDTSLFTVDTTGFVDTIDPMGEFSVRQSGNSLYLDYSVIPEPALTSLMVMGAGLFMMARRRRQGTRI